MKLPILKLIALFNGVESNQTGIAAFQSAWDVATDESFDQLVASFTALAPCLAQGIDLTHPIDRRCRQRLKQNSNFPLVGQLRSGLESLSASKNYVENRWTTVGNRRIFMAVMGLNSISISWLDVPASAGNAALRKVAAPGCCSHRPPA